VKEITARELLNQLREAVELLAAPGDEQERWLIQHRMPVDELALQLDDAVPGWFPRLAGAGLLDPKAEASLRALDAELGRFSGPQNASLWTEEALYDATEWTNVRTLAARALSTLSVS
jgi:hypothetical protein